jgi:hypothetical protein
MYVIAIEDTNQPLGFKLFSGFIREEAHFDALCAYSFANQQKTFKALVFMGLDYGRQELNRYSGILKEKAPQYPTVPERRDCRFRIWALPR